MFKGLYTKKKENIKMSASLGNLFQFGDSSQKDPFSSKKENMNDDSEDSDSENKKKEETFSSVKKKLTEGKRGRKSAKKNAESDEGEKENDSDNEDESFASSKKLLEGKRGRSIMKSAKSAKSAKSKNENGDEDGNESDDGSDDDDGEGFHNMTTKKIPFWVTNPNVLLDSRYITEWFPVEGMSYNQKLNAISRLVILLTVIGFVFLRAFRLLWIGGVCLLVIFLLHYSQTRSVGGGKQEGFYGNAPNDKLRGGDPALHAIVNFATNDPSKIGKKEYFDVPKINNPYNNVLVTDIVDNPDKLPAPPAYYPETEKAILDRTKEAIQKMNPTFPGIIKKLFSSFDDHFEFEQSMRQYHSNPSTTVPNDQGAFAEFCYGEMISCKEGNQFACARDSARYNLY